VSEMTSVIARALRIRRWTLSVAKREEIALQAIAENRKWSGGSDTLKVSIRRLKVWRPWPRKPYHITCEYGTGNTYWEALGLCPLRCMGT